MDDGSSKGFFARLTNLFPHRNHSAEDFEKEIQTLIAEGEEQGIIQHAEGEMLQSIFDFRDTIVREVMVPRTACVGLSIETPIEEVVAVIIQHGHTRIPVFDGDIDHVLGILHAKDFLQFWGQQIGPDEIRSILRRPSFVPETKLIRDVLSEMRRREEHLAIVIDEYGGTAGLITIEDILEEIVGEIRYEHDQEEPGLVALDDGSVLVDARLSAVDLAAHYQLELPEGDFESVGGLLIHLTGRVPQTKEKIVFGPVQFIVQSADQRRVHQVRIDSVESPPVAESDPSK
ncbi:MAG: hemolysin family protein [Proteobacteria bacterium]|nr:hemolysin family protein [Pseudomonadota bacterium]